MVATHDESTREKQHFERIRLVAAIERARLLLVKYNEGQAHYHNLIEESRYQIGRLDQSLGDA
jgi:hypothetical protein